MRSARLCATPIASASLTPDCWVDDSRFVALSALDAKERGATISVGTRLIAARRDGARWIATLDGGVEIEARALVNAAGPWVSQVIGGALHVHALKHVRLVKGSHLVTRKLYEGDHAYILQNPDGRIVFAIPFERGFTLIGTTDVSYSGAPGPVSISETETDYLLGSINHFLRKPVTRGDIVWSYSGLRPLYDDGALKASVVTRDYAFDLDAPGNAPPALSIFGGKITTARRLAEHALDELRRFLPSHGETWTEGAVLPGGDMEFGRISRASEGREAFSRRRSRASAGARLWHADRTLPQAGARNGRFGPRLWLRAHRSGSPVFD